MNRPNSSTRSVKSAGADSELLLAQSGHGINLGCAVCRSIAGEQSPQNGGNAEKCADVDGADIVEQTTKRREVPPSAGGGQLCVRFRTVPLMQPGLAPV